MAKGLKENFNVICCDLCFEKIGKKSPKAARLWLDLCDLHEYYKGVFSIAKFTNPELKQLENLGFLVTHENEHNLLVKMEGYHASPCVYFCKGNCDA